MNKKLKIGIIGLGTVGCGTVKVLNNFPDIDIVSVCVKNLKKERPVKVNNLTDDPYDIVANPNVDVVVEVAGGLEVKDYLICALQNGKHIVTANKELLAKHGPELFDHARKNGVTILYEASVAGGIPIILPIKTSLCANKFESVQGILNGTTNYILTKMEEENLSYNECLKKAQELGFAETDPTNDVEGFDAMYKIAILASIVFKKDIDLSKIYCEGITKITQDDIKIADELGYKIKLIAMAKQAQMQNNSVLDIRVHPMFVSKTKSISDIKNATNAVVLNGFPVNKVMFSGPGAGEFPTASSVVGDILTLKSEIENANVLPMTLNYNQDKAYQIDIKDTINCYYLSINALNEPGEIGRIGYELGRNGINISCIIQKGVCSDGTAKVIVITEETFERDVDKMIETLEENGVTKVVNKIRLM